MYRIAMCVLFKSYVKENRVKDRLMQEKNEYDKATWSILRNDYRLICEHDFLRYHS